MRTELDMSTFLLEMEKKLNGIQLFCPVGNHSLDTLHCSTLRRTTKMT